MGKFIKEFFGWYYLIFGLAFFSIYHLPVITPFLNVFILVYSYYLIYRFRRLDVVIILILFSRCLNGFIVSHDLTFYKLINFLSNIAPILIYYISVLTSPGISFKPLWTLKRFKFTL